MILACTGHRPDKLLNEWDGVGPVSRAINAALYAVLMQKKPTRVICGCALGVDMLWGRTARGLGIPVTAAVPFEGFDKKWPKASRDRLREFLASPLVTKVVCAPGDGEIGAAHKLQNRNRWMVDNAPDGLVACWDGTSGGTANCIKYAESLGREITFIRPTDISRTTWEIA